MNLFIMILFNMLYSFTIGNSSEEEELSKDISMVYLIYIGDIIKFIQLSISIISIYNSLGILDQKYDVFIKNKNQKCNRSEPCRFPGCTRSGHVNRVDYRPRDSKENVDPEFKKRIDMKECGDLCNRYTNCSFFFYNVDRFCDLFEFCDGKFGPIRAGNPGTTYQKIISGKISYLLRNVSVINQKINCIYVKLRSLKFTSGTFPATIKTVPSAPSTLASNHSITKKTMTTGATKEKGLTGNIVFFFQNENMGKFRIPL